MNTAIPTKYPTNAIQRIFLRYQPKVIFSIQSAIKSDIFKKPIFSCKKAFTATSLAAFKTQGILPPFSALEKAYSNAKKESEKEHVTPYIIKNPKLFKIKNFSSPQNIRHLSFAVDFKKDLSFLKKLFKKINKRKNLNLSCKNLIKMTSKI